MLSCADHQVVRQQLFLRAPKVLAQAPTTSTVSTQLFFRVVEKFLASPSPPWYTSTLLVVCQQLV